jgi:hypothetical protein
MLWSVGSARTVIRRFDKSRKSCFKGCENEPAAREAVVSRRFVRGAWATFIWQEAEGEQTLANQALTSIWLP